jgi:hypothetical protein
VCYPVPGGNKYRILALQVGGVTKIETIKYAHEFCRSEEDCTGDAWQKLKTTDQTSHQRGCSISTNPQLYKIIKERRGKIGLGSQMGA